MPTQQVHSQDIQTPLVSFIVTTFNLPTAYLKECLESITALSLAKSEREIIVVDDGSDISPINELLGLREHIVYIRQENQGVSEARNTGIRRHRENSSSLSTETTIFSKLPMSIVLTLCAITNLMS